MVVLKLRTPLSVRQNCWFNLVHYICKFCIIYVFVCPIYYTLVRIRLCSHVVLWIILTFPARWFSFVGNAYGSVRHCRHCTPGCIAYSRLLCRFSLFRSLSRVPGTQSRRPSSLSDPRPFIRLHLRYITEKELYRVRGMVGAHWTIWNAWFMSSCGSGCGLGLPSFPVS